MPAKGALYPAATQEQGSAYTPQELLGPKDGEDEQQGDAEDDSQQVGKQAQLRVAETLSQRQTAGTRDGQRHCGRGHIMGGFSLAARLRAQVQCVNPRLAQEVALLGLVLETELPALQDDVVGLQAKQGQQGSVRGQVSNRLSRGQHSGLATERAEQAALGWGHQAEVGQAFEAEGVAAVQHLGGVEGVVEGVPAHGTLSLQLAALLLHHAQAMVR